MAESIYAANYATTGNRFSTPEATPTIECLVGTSIESMRIVGTPIDLST